MYITLDAKAVANLIKTEGEEFRIELRHGLINAAAAHFRQLIGDANLIEIRKAVEAELEKQVLGNFGTYVTEAKGRWGEEKKLVLRDGLKKELSEAAKQIVDEQGLLNFARQEIEKKVTEAAEKVEVRFDGIEKKLEEKINLLFNDKLMKRVDAYIDSEIERRMAARLNLT